MALLAEGRLIPLGVYKHGPPGGGPTHCTSCDSNPRSGDGVSSEVGDGSNACAIVTLSKTVTRYAGSIAVCDNSRSLEPRHGSEIAASLLGLIIHIIWSMPCAEASIVASATTAPSREMSTDACPFASIDSSVIANRHIRWCEPASRDSRDGVRRVIAWRGNGRSCSRKRFRPPSSRCPCLLT
jgi:hypothetical protein